MLAGINDDGVDTVRVTDNVHDFDSEPKKSQEEFTPSTSASLSRHPSFVLVAHF